MPDIIFGVTSVTEQPQRDGTKSVLKKGRLKWEAHKLDSPAWCGGFKLGAIPKGSYEVHGNGFQDRPEGHPHYSPEYCDKDQKNCWFHWIDTRHVTEPARSDIGFHPDFDRNGTFGCIGIKDDNTSAWRLALKDLKDKDLLILEVTK